MAVHTVDTYTGNRHKFRDKRVALLWRTAFERMMGRGTAVYKRRFGEAPDRDFDRRAEKAAKRILARLAEDR